MRILHHIYVFAKKSTFRHMATLGILLIYTGLLTSCDLITRYGRYSGIDRVALRGHPAASSLIWSRTDPNKILVSASEVGFGFELLGSQVFVLDITTGDKKVIAKTDYGIINGETWSPDGEKVVLEFYSSTKGYENYKGLWIWDAKKDSLEFFKEGPNALWSPTGETIAIFDSSDDGDLELLYLYSIDTKSEETMTIGAYDTIGYVWGTDWSPDGRRLVLSLGDPKSSVEFNLFIYDTKTHELVRLTDDGNNSYPAWSPHGDKIAYVMHIPGSNMDSVHLMNVDGSCDTEFPYIDWVLSLTWSPDGKRLAFVGPDGIYTIDLDIFLEANGINLCP
jgi:Tol biopolymer transport system component